MCRPFSAFLKRAGRATALPIVLVPKFGYSEKSSRRASIDGAWKANDRGWSRSGRGMLNGPEVVSGIAVITILNNGEELR